MSAAHPTVPLSSAATVPAPPPSARVPWYVWIGMAAITSASIGGAWDVSWHRSIGRDTFWTPAHLMIQACAVLAGIVGVILVSQCTWGSDRRLREASVSILGLRAPLGVFLLGWGGLAMLTSAPFDNWWHNAYGLDVKIVSPPHVLLILGIRAVSFGMLFLILAAMNRAGESGADNFAALRRCFLFLGGLIVGGQMFFLLEYTWDVLLHTMGAYTSVAIAVPIIFAAISQSARFRWTCTTIASIYTAIAIAEILILPLFPAQPKLGPVYFPVTHLVPAKFPVLILAPALALDLLWQKTRDWSFWKLALVSSAVFVLVLFAVEWPFANFLLSKFSENRFFGTIYFDYNSPANGPDRMRQFVDAARGMQIVYGLLRAIVYGFLSTWLGLLLGRWMRTVRR